MIPLLLLVAATTAHAADTDSTKAAATRKKLQDKVTVEWKDELFRNVIDALNDSVPALGVRADTKGGVNLNAKITYAARDKPVGDVLNEICDKYDMGWYIISNKANGYDGTVWVTRGKERGYEAGKEPDKTATKDKPDPKDKPNPKDKPDPKDKPNPKDKPDPKVNPDPKDKPETKPEDDADEIERKAGRKLRLAKELVEDNQVDKAKDNLEELLKKYPKTRAAEEAKKLLDKLNQ
jgi:hypothetical protein